VLCFATLFLAGGALSTAVEQFALAYWQELTVTASFENKTILQTDEILLRLNRPLQPSETRIAVFIGSTDMSNLFAITPDALTYAPRLPLPVGDTEVVVYLISEQGVWKKIAAFALRVREGSSNTGNLNGSRRVNFTPSVTIGVKSQLAQSYSPVSSPPSRERFTDLTLAGSFRMDVAGSAFESKLQFDVAGSSYRNEALRFAQEGSDAPRVDLSSYLTQFQAGKARFQLGHIAFGTNRHLINNFSSRGISLNFPLSRRADFSAAAMNGTAIVGWDNFFGLNSRKHQVIAATLGFEVFPNNPGELRVEGGVVGGSLLPKNNFNQGSLTDAEHSKGLSFRVLAADPSQRVRLDAGFARSRFKNPTDPLLNQSFDAVAVRETTRDARYFEGSLNAVRNAPIGGTRTASLTINYRHEAIDPLFRSIAAFNQADRFQNQVEMVAIAGEVTATVSHQRYHDNLDDIPAILKTLTRRTGLIVGAPLLSVFGNTDKPSAWWPRVSYAYDRTHQFGAATPVNSGFASASQIPDQISTNQIALADWQFQKLRFGYRFNRSFQDNRQPGRERADLRNLVDGFSFGITPSQAIDFNIDVNLESAKNFETRRVDRTNRTGLNLNWRLTPRAALAAMVSTIFARDLADTSKTRNGEVDLTWSYRFGVEASRYKKVQGQFFVRYANRYQRARDNVFGLDSLVKIQTFNTGLSFTFF
jgi:hypothetical protein